MPRSGEVVALNDRDKQQLIEEFLGALQAGDVKEARRFMEDHYTEDYIEEYPQSGERIRGLDACIAALEEYPTIPSLTPRSVRGSGDVWVAEATMQYGPDTMQSVFIIEFRKNKIARTTAYWGTPFPAPEWRAKYVERM